MKVAPRLPPGMMLPGYPVVEELFETIYEDGELLVINKPAGLVCHPTKTDEYSSLISRARLHLGPGAHPQLVNRLDRETSGVTLMAKGAEAARELRRIWENRQVEKDYLAIVHGHVREERGVIDAPLGKDEHSRVVIKDCVRADGAAAQTGYSVQRRFTVMVNCPSPSCSCSRRLGASIRYGFIWRTSGIRLWATSCMGATRTCIWRWWRIV
jgi:23S rRNA-/tRNA-specific pseudouridylate synthase